VRGLGSCGHPIPPPLVLVRNVGVSKPALQQGKLNTCVLNAKIQTQHKRTAWGDAGDAVAAPMPENRRLFGQKISKIGQIKKLYSHLSKLESFR